MKKILIIISQLLILVTIRLIYLDRVKTLVLDRAAIKRPIVIASNHAAGLDPFIVACFLPLKTIFRVFPYKFMTANVYYYRPWKFLAWWAGCYPAKARWDGEDQSLYGVGASVKFVKGRYSIVMFPEGKRTTQPISAKPGISHILEQTDAPLVLCRVNWRSGGLFRHVRMSIKLAPENLDRTDPKAIMKAVYDLPLEHKVVMAKKEA